MVVHPFSAIDLVLSISARVFCQTEIEVSLQLILTLLSLEHHRDQLYLARVLQMSQISNKLPLLIEATSRLNSSLSWSHNLSMNWYQQKNRN